MLIVSCGSSTGWVKDFRSYNSVKFSPKTVAVAQFVEQKPGAGLDRKDIMAFAVDR
jgi:hypothetical protein